MDNCEKNSFYTQVSISPAAVLL